LIKRIYECVREYKAPMFLTLFFITMESVIEVLIPFTTADLVNRIKSGIEMEELLQTGGKLVIMSLLSLACGAIAAYTCSKASTGLARNLRHDIFHKIQTYSFENIDKFSSSSLITRLTTDVNHVQMSFMMLIRTAIRSPLMLLFSIIMSYIMAGPLAATFIVIVPVLAFGLFLVAKNALPSFRRVFKKYDRLNESVEENVRAMRVVKGFSREAHEKVKFHEASDNIRKEFTRAERIVALNTPLMQLCVYFNIVFVLSLGSKLVVTSQGALVDVGQISAMLTYGMQVLMQLMMLSTIAVTLTMSAESVKRINELLTEESSIVSPENGITEVPNGSIDFENVSFKYFKSAKRDTLSGIDLHIKSGMTVGILGNTGVGKSTLVQLIPRLYDTSEGTVRVGGVDVRDYDLDALRHSVAMVLQKNVLFAGTIKENLRWGDENASDEALAEACRLAQADSFIRSFPDGYDTHIEQGGTNVSGGQKQRLCIARALLKKPKILILDDSTSAVDTRTDALIREGLRSYLPDTTKLIIAQRIASVQDADMILIMDNGAIVAAGTHEELLVSSKTYRDIYLQQTKGGEENA